MNKEKWFNGFYNYTVVLTYMGMVSGFCGIAALFKGNFRCAVICLMAAGIFDMFDGAVASTRKRTDSEKRFGIQIDSLSDLICFGVFPALFTYIACGQRLPAMISGAVYLLAALIRLAYFNVCEEERQREESGRRKYYDGLPVTSAALIFPLFYIVNVLFDVPFIWMLPALAALMAFAFLFAFRLKKSGTIGLAVMGLIGIAEFFVVLFSAKLR